MALVGKLQILVIFAVFGKLRGLYSPDVAHFNAIVIVFEKCHINALQKVTSDAGPYNCYFLAWTQIFSFTSK